jgi:hypothetical protein
MICCGNWYLCQAKRRCDDEPECHALARAVVGASEDRFRSCRVMWDGRGFRYEFDLLPTVDLRGAVKRWRRRTTK